MSQCSQCTQVILRTRCSCFRRVSRIHLTDSQITVTALSPMLILSAVEVQLEWEKAIHHLRRDGARPKEVRHTS